MSLWLLLESGLTFSGLREVLGRPLSHLVSKTLDSLSANPNQVMHAKIIMDQNLPTSSGLGEAL